VIPVEARKLTRRIGATTAGRHWSRKSAHFASLFSAEIVTAEQWNPDALEIIGELIE